MRLRHNCYGHVRLSVGTTVELQLSGVATPGHTRACARVKFVCARAKIMQKAKVKDQQLFTRAHSSTCCMVQLPITRTLLKRGLRANNSVMRSKRSDNESTMKLQEPFLVAKIMHEIFFHASCGFSAASQHLQRCTVAPSAVGPSSTHVTFSFWLRHCYS